uniref:Spore coat protein Z n=1 Tax=Strongyloides papillosus TaxID=174720 RepID=A0A0N5C6J0_STREA
MERQLNAMQKCNVTISNAKYLSQSENECIDNELWGSSYNKQYVSTCCDLFLPFNCSQNCRDSLGDSFMKEQDRLVEAVKCDIPDDSDPKYCHLTFKIQMTNCFGMCINYFLYSSNVTEIRDSTNTNYFLLPNNRFFNDCRKTIKFQNLKPCIGPEIDD